MGFVMLTNVLAVFYIDRLTGPPKLFELPNGCQIIDRLTEDYGNVGWLKRMYTKEGAILKYNSFDEDLENELHSNYDIMKIYSPDGNLIWKRPEEVIKVKEVTMADLEKKYNCKIKVIKGDK